MNSKLIQPFIEATQNVVKIMTDLELSAGTPYLKKDKAAKGDLSGVLGMIGDFNGTLSVSFTEAGILQIVSGMFGERIEQLDDEIHDAAGELTNMISGQARRNLETMGISLEAAIPTVIQGKCHMIKHITSAPTVAVDFRLRTGGEFTVELCLEGPR